jgi:CDGSH-type Zn-finger protein
MPRDPVEIRSYPDGPYLVRGAKGVVGADGEEIELSRRVVAICRCGRSRNYPFCDGTHKLVDFQAPGGARFGR